MPNILIKSKCSVFDTHTDEKGNLRATLRSAEPIVPALAQDAKLIEHGYVKNGNWINVSIFDVKFKKDAEEKLKSLKNGSRIKNLECSWDIKPYWDDKNNCLSYLKSKIKLTVFDFEVDTDGGSNATTRSNLDKAPQVAEASQPIAPAQENIVENLYDNATAADECPF